MSERKHLTEENSILEGNEQLTKAELSAKIAASLAGRAAMTKLPKIALGAWAWGNDGTFGNNLTAENLKPIFDTAMENGLNLWDTAYAYGMGTSEKVLAGFLKAMG
jgi:aryl-alcohol dehydrogenase-like predicted oxidoreductase